MKNTTSIFTRRTAVQAAALLPWTAVRGSAANSTVTVGLIGSGNRGTFVAGLLAKNTPARVVALCDVFDEKMEGARKSIGLENPKLYQDFRQLLASDVDAVIIATPASGAHRAFLAVCVLPG